MTIVYNTPSRPLPRDPAFTRPAAIVPGTPDSPGLAIQGDGDTGFFAPAADALSAVAGGREVARFTASGAGTCGFQVTAGVGASYLRTQGTDANITVQVEAKGQGVVQFMTRGGTGFRVSNSVDGAINFLYVSGNTGTASPYMAAVGQAPSLDVWLQPKGTGVLRLNYPFQAAASPGAFTADRWLAVKDSTSTVYYIPCRSTPW